LSKLEELEDKYVVEHVTREATDPWGIFD